MAQQTAVEWLINQSLNWSRDTKNSNDYIEFPKNAIKQAKQMEKEQRIKDYNAGYDDAQCNHINDAENYANEQEYVK
jgi:hypothetical protein